MHDPLNLEFLLAKSCRQIRSAQESLLLLWRVPFSNHILLYKVLLYADKSERT